MFLNSKGVLCFYIKYEKASISFLPKYQTHDINKVFIHSSKMGKVESGNKFMQK